MGMIDTADRVTLGKVSGVIGLQGWLKIYSDTDPREGIIAYKSWWLRYHGLWQKYLLEKGKVHGKGVIVKLADVNNRTAAELLIGRTIAVDRADLPELDKEEYYWRDLVGMEVITVHGTKLGIIDSLFATGANDVVVVSGDRERLIPWIRDQVVVEVDLDSGILTVDWDPDF